MLPSVLLAGLLVGVGGIVCTVVMSFCCRKGELVKENEGNGFSRSFVGGSAPNGGGSDLSSGFLAVKPEGGGAVCHRSTDGSSGLKVRKESSLKSPISKGMVCSRDGLVSELREEGYTCLQVLTVKDDGVIIARTGH